MMIIAEWAGFPPERWLFAMAVLWWINIASFAFASFDLDLSLIAIQTVEWLMTETKRLQLLLSELITHPAASAVYYPQSFPSLGRGRRGTVGIG